MNKVPKSYNQCQEVLDIRSKVTTRVINTILKYHFSYKRVFPSLSRIADGSQCSETSVKRVMRWLREKNLMVSEFRQHRSSVIKLSPLFEQYAPLLKRKFHALKNVVTLSYILSIFGEYSYAYFRGQITNGLHNKKELIIYPSPCKSLVQRCPTKPDKERGVNKLREERMEMGKVVISETLMLITRHLGLTKWGQLKLIPFSEKALRAAYKSYKETRSVQDPFTYIFLGCQMISKAESLDIDWKTYYDLLEEYPMPPDAPMTMKKKTSNGVVSVDSLQIPTQQTTILPHAFKDESKMTQVEQTTHVPSSCPAPKKLFVKIDPLTPEEIAAKERKEILRREFQAIIDANTHKIGGEQANQNHPESSNQTKNGYFDAFKKLIPLHVQQEIEKY